METQKFKGDPLELQMEAAAEPAFEITSASLDDFFANGFTASPFLLMLYDQGRMPFSDRVPRDSFVDFINEALVRFPFTGTFESYIFILQKIFGTGSGILFEVPAPGKLNISVNAATRLDFDWQASEFIDGAYVYSNMITSINDAIQFSGISGIDNEYQLTQLLAEIIPAGIYPVVDLSFFELFNFIGIDNLGVESAIVDHNGNSIVFIETGA